MDGYFALITEVAGYKATLGCCTVTTAGLAVSKTSFALATASNTRPHLISVNKHIMAVGPYVP